MNKKFAKNDTSFVCTVCGKKVPALQVTSRDHCNNCLYGLHIDINPGDRANNCKGILKPISIVHSGKKGYIIQYKCEKCGEVIMNKAAADDNFEEILNICKAQ